MAISEKKSMKPVNNKQDNRKQAEAVRTTPVLSSVSVHTQENAPATRGKKNDVDGK